MGNIFNLPGIKLDPFGRPRAAINKDKFKDILGNKVEDIISFDNGTDELLEQGRIILPRHYHIFVGTKNNEVQFKPYEYDQYRIVVATFNDVIVSVETIG